MSPSSSEAAIKDFAEPTIIKVAKIIRVSVPRLLSCVRPDCDFISPSLALRGFGPADHQKILPLNALASQLDLRVRTEGGLARRPELGAACDRVVGNLI